MDEKKTPLKVVILDDKSFNLTDIVSICQIQETHIIEFVEHGILEPQGDEPESWAFSASNLARAQKAIRLQRDLEINLAGIAIILDLLDELSTLRQKMHLLEK